MITVTGATSDLIAVKQDATHPLHDLVETLSLFTITTANGQFVFTATDEQTFVEQVDLPTALAIAERGLFDIEGYPVYLKVEEDMMADEVSEGFPLRSVIDEVTEEETVLTWEEYELGSLVWEDFPESGAVVYTLGNLSAFSRSMFRMSEINTMASNAMPGVSFISREERVALG